MSKITEVSYLREKQWIYFIHIFVSFSLSVYLAMSSNTLYYILNSIHRPVKFGFISLEDAYLVKRMHLSTYSIRQLMVNQWKNFFSAFKYSL